MPPFGRVIPPNQTISDILLNATSPLRYGGTNKADMEFYGVPGAFKGVSGGNPYAERAASAYAGAQKWGEIPAKIFNTFALNDLPFVSSQYDATGRKAAGYAAAEAGAMGELPDPYLPPTADTSNVNTQAFNFRTPEQFTDAPAAPFVPPVNVPNVPIPTQYDPIMDDPIGSGLGRNVGLSFGGMQDPSNPLTGSPLPNVNVPQGDMAFAEMNQQRVNQGLPPLDPSTGLPVGSTTQAVPVQNEAARQEQHAYNVGVTADQNYSELGPSNFGNTNTNPYGGGVSPYAPAAAGQYNNPSRNPADLDPGGHWEGMTWIPGGATGTTGTPTGATSTPATTQTTTGLPKASAGGQRQPPTGSQQPTQPLNTGPISGGGPGPYGRILEPVEAQTYSRSGGTMTLGDILAGGGFGRLGNKYR